MMAIVPYSQQFFLHFGIFPVAILNFDRKKETVDKGNAKCLLKLIEKLKGAGLT